MWRVKRISATHAFRNLFKVKKFFDFFDSALWSLADCAACFTAVSGFCSVKQFKLLLQHAARWCHTRCAFHGSMREGKLLFSCPWKLICRRLFITFRYCPSHAIVRYARVCACMCLCVSESVWNLNTAYLYERVCVCLFYAFTIRFH